MLVVLDKSAFWKSQDRLQHFKDELRKIKLDLHTSLQMFMSSDLRQLRHSVESLVMHFEEILSPLQELVHAVPLRQNDSYAYASIQRLETMPDP